MGKAENPFFTLELKLKPTGTVFPEFKMYQENAITFFFNICTSLPKQIQLDSFFIYTSINATKTELNLFKTYISNGTSFSLNKFLLILESGLFRPTIYRNRVYVYCFCLFKMNRRGSER
jgi:hypothetical protein